jgi:hypothetical protein
LFNEAALDTYHQNRGSFGEEFNREREGMVAFSFTVDAVYLPEHLVFTNPLFLLFRESKISPFALIQNNRQKLLCLPWSSALWQVDERITPFRNALVRNISRIYSFGFVMDSTYEFQSLFLAGEST